MAGDVSDGADFVLNEADMVPITCSACSKETLRSLTWLRSSGTFTCPFCGAETELSHPEEN